MVTMFGWFKAASACASRANRLGELGVAHPLRREQFQRDEPVQALLPRLIDHPHAAASEAFEDFQLRKMRRDLFGRQRRLRGGPVARENRFRLQVQRHQAIGAKPRGRALSERRAALRTLGDDSLLMPDTYPLAEACYTARSFLLPGQGRGQMAQFRLQISAVGQCLRNLLPIDFAKPLPQPMHRHARRPFVHAKPFRHRRVINRPALRHEATLERLKITRLALPPRIPRATGSRSSPAA